MPQAFHALVISLIYEGVFERFPTLKIVLIEGGFAWLAPLMWRMDRAWEAMRDEGLTGVGNSKKWQGYMNGESVDLATIEGETGTTSGGRRLSGDNGVGCHDCPPLGNIL